MGTQAYRANYREAFQHANHQLDEIYSDYHELQLRKEQIERALVALEPFLQAKQSSLKDEMFVAEPIHVETAPELEAVPEPVMHYAPAIEPAKMPVVSEPVVAPSYAPVSEANLDPIQARINRALGLAVA